MLRTVARRVESPRHIAELGVAFIGVMRDIRSGRPAPGALEIPIDLQYAACAEIEFPDLDLPVFAPDAGALRPFCREVG